MTREPHVVALPGSLREESRTRTALRVALSAAREEGASTALLDLREYDLPPVVGDARDAGDAPRLKREMGRAEAVILGTPTYHGSYAAPLKNALDYCGREEFAGLPVGLLEVAGGRFPRTAMAHLRTVVRTLDAWALPHQVAIANSADVVRDGRIDDEEIRARTRELGREATRYAGVERYPELAAATGEPLPGD